MDTTYCSVGELFGVIACSNAGNTALYFRDDRISYAQLQMLSNQCAQYLSKRGLLNGDVVAIFHDKTVLGYAVMLACLKIGAPYVNLNPSAPYEQIKKIIETCNPKICFYGRVYCDDVVKRYEDVMQSYDDAQFRRELQMYSNCNLNQSHKVLGSDPAYIMFTSGSTGFPKGAVITNEGLLHFIMWSKNTFSIKTDHIFTNINPMYFDNSVFDFYSSLLTGAGLAPIADKLTKNPRRMVKYIEEMKCTHWFSVPSMLVYALKMRAIDAGDMTALKTIIFGGEGFPKSGLRELYALLGKRISFVNVYGPTECTCICSSYSVDEKDLADPTLLPLGSIASQFTFRIINDDGGEAKNGEPGELCLKGVGVGLGYYNNTEQTERAFVADPFAGTKAERMYKTGDIVWYEEKTNLLWFCGRKDNQIKIMGHRVELEEIDVALNGLDGVREAACIFKKRNAEDVGKIIAFVVGEKNEEYILERVRTLLPSYMIPNQIVILGQLPKSHNGKISRKKLYEMEISV